MSQTVGSLTRETYAARRVAARYRQRGDAMVLRRISLAAIASPLAPVPYKNPPDVSADLVVATGIAVTGQAYLGISGPSRSSTATGRLIPGDQIQCFTGSTLTATWRVVTMPTGILTDADGIPEAALDGTPVLGTPPYYSPDSNASANRWTVVPVVTVSGDANPAHAIGQAVSFIFRADVPVYGIALSLSRMTAMGWTEVDGIGLNLAADNGAPISPPPAVDDVVVVAGKPRSIISANQLFRHGTQLLYPVQCR